MEPAGSPCRQMMRFAPYYDGLTAGDPSAEGISIERLAFLSHNKPPLLAKGAPVLSEESGFGGDPVSPRGSEVLQGSFTLRMGG